MPRKLALWLQLKRRRAESIERNKYMKTLFSEIKVEKLERPEHCGDWHDKPLRYAVNGPRSECQKFSTKKDAMTYRSMRARTNDQLVAINSYRSTYSKPL